MAKYRDVLIQAFTPPLTNQGYSPVEQSRHGHIGIAFAKTLPDGVTAEIVLSPITKKDLLVRRAFHIILSRSKSEPSENLTYEGALGENLTSLVHSVLRGPIENPKAPLALVDRLYYSEPDIDLVIQALEQIGIPWLEDADSRNLGYIPPDDRHRFRETVLRLTSQRLQQLNFKVTDVSIENYVHFRKSIGDEYGHIGWHQFRDALSGKLQLEIILKRNRSPATNDPTYLNLLNSLSNLVRRDNPAEQFLGPNPKWSYRSEAQLRLSIADALEKLTALGIPWLEDPQSTNLLISDG